MSSYISRVIGFFIVLYALILPSAMMNAFADNDASTEKTYTDSNNKTDNIGVSVNRLNKKFLNSTINKNDDIQKNEDISEPDTPNSIARHLQTAGNMLSSSPAELAEQAKSYALGKLNSSISSEAQKWLSQFGTARINLSVDKKGTLENSALDILFPVYDNKAEWLLFSQVGYRNKDSRNTLNFGVGGRYFQNNWMYGLNTFFDHDFTGKNRRLGLGGEIWGDYLKLSANTYYRLSDWQHSRDHKDYYERPANGYDINGEFFLPAYPNLGAKLTYEQYFGDNVTLFNRDTKQKNPSLAKLGLTYTPIPLVTMGVDYKQGGSGHTETQFLANLNYRLGVPLSVQLSPDNVASMRTLAGSRYDLVERNYNIVLDHKKKQSAQLFLDNQIVGYSHELREGITANIVSDTPVKQIDWSASRAFEQQGGKLSPMTGKTTSVTFPKYSPDGNDNYSIEAVALLENNQKLGPVRMSVIVRPFVVKKAEADTSYITPAGPLPASGKDKDAYTITPVITFDTPVGAPVKNATIDDVQWITEPPAGDASGLKLSWEKPETTKTDENGKLKAVTLTSTKPQQNVKVYLQMGDADKEKQLVGTVSFGEDTARFHVNSIQVEPKETLTADGTQAYTYTALVLDGNNQPVKGQKIDKVQWEHDKKDKTGLDLKGGDTTNEEGKLTATLTSSEPVDNVMVTLSIEGNTDKPAKAKEVSFTAADIVLTHKPKSSHALIYDSYTYTATINDASGNPEKNKTVEWKLQQEISGVTLTPVTTTTNKDGIVTAKLTSTTPAQNVIVTVSVDGKTKPAPPVNFQWPTITAVNVLPPSSGAVAGDKKGYQFTANVVGIDGTTPYTGKDIKFQWQLQLPQGAATDETKLLHEVTDNQNKTWTVQLTSTQTQPTPVEGAKVCLAIADAPSVKRCSEPVSFEVPTEDFEIAKVEVINPTPTLEGNGTDKYQYRALIVKKSGGKYANHSFKDVKWQRDHQINEKELPQPEWTSSKTDGGGYLYATLKSHVGVNDVNVTLTMPDKNGKPLPAEVADKLVSFVPKPQKAVMYAYNKYDEKLANRVFSEPHPYNFFDSLNGELRAASNPQKPFDKTELSYSLENNNSEYPFVVEIGSDKKGPIVFRAPGSQTIKATITKPDGRIELYKYNISLGRPIVFNTGQPNDGSSYSIYHGINDGVSCDSVLMNGMSTVSLSIKDVKSSYGENTLGAEFKNLLNWGVFHGHSADIIGNLVTIKVKTETGGINGPYAIYNSITDQIDGPSDTSGLLVCTNE
ncbi:inverse autotransporter beta domain-containing protein [Xenorhabdus bovienii]|uniref:inverse autotransporter beta domain-containing protein n=1 Tax=Xenorhabdus bovienii TaxID=40576 RepID=UPI0023B26A18|nr:inverse autotransporter beta domain-containing protein [Xenorhabdus bovienii]MDE9495185.1 inverse autotransporter beta domain-containing protein [Xenorhabdus bovienii]MDE9503578.1 inverse autotransporter beta domain-containing protein [Xenorhabdus bovienii]MDE9527301.1 inverse autotransporter beta domain-containing protein [Xenorhabdus bovienii]MDE9570450.1 inverse autotransporter beta domain-containing protein [Xenorhabdus bovienii]